MGSAVRKSQSLAPARLTPLCSYLNVANAAMKTRSWAGEDGIITEGASPKENNDGVGFKGVFSESRVSV